MKHKLIAMTLFLSVSALFISQTIFAQNKPMRKMDSMKTCPMAAKMNSTCPMHTAMKTAGAGDSCCKNMRCSKDSTAKACSMKDSSKQCKMDSACCQAKAASKSGACRMSGEAGGKTGGKTGCKNDRKADAGIQQKTCPVMGEPIDKSVSLQYKGKTIYFCCDGCKEKFLKSPEKYLKKIK